MIIEVQKSFEKDIEKITDKKLAIQVQLLIQEFENAKLLSAIGNIKKMKAKGFYYRARIGNYRVGFKVEKNTVTLLRFMHRKEIYNYFP